MSHGMRPVRGGVLGLARARVVVGACLVFLSASLLVLDVGYIATNSASRNGDLSTEGITLDAISLRATTGRPLRVGIAQDIVPTWSAQPAADGAHASQPARQAYGRERAKRSAAGRDSQTLQRTTSEEDTATSKHLRAVHQVPNVDKGATAVATTRRTHARVALQPFSTYGRTQPPTSTTVGAAAATTSNTSAHDAAVASKVQRWRKRNAFFLQYGALTSVIRNKCLDSGGGVWPNRLLKMMTCQDSVGPNQRFEMIGGALVQPKGPGSAHHHLTCIAVSEVSEISAHRLSSNSSSSDSGAVLAVTQPCFEDAHGRPLPRQRWSFEPVPSLQKQYGFVRSGAASGGCLTKPPVGRGTNKNAPVVVQPCSGWCNQTWSLGAAVTVARPATWRPRVNGGRGAGRVLCWILTYPAASDTKAVAVNRTWGSKCDYLLFMTSGEHVDGLNTVRLALVLMVLI
jgi:hypothetical protein